MKNRIKLMIKPAVRGLAAYSPGLVKAAVKVDSNENNYDIPSSVRRQIMKEIAAMPFNRYPKVPDELKRKLAARLKTQPELITLGNGSDELLYCLLLAFVSEGDSVIVPAPSFEMYSILAKIAGAKVIEAPLGKEHDLDAEEVIRQAKKNRAKFVFLAYPNNPTGNCFDRKKILEIIKRSGAIVVCDEAYHEFSGKTFVSEMKKHENLVVMRTFSKAFSMAGIRLGYMAASKEITEAVNKVKLPYNINTLTIKAALAGLKHEKEIQKSVRSIISEREKMRKFFQQKLGSADSSANFFYFKAQDPLALKKLFQKRGVSIRIFNNGAAKGFARITVGKPAENRLIMKILARGV